MKIVEHIKIGQKILTGKILRKKFPLSVEFGITYQCNLACKYCLLDNPENYYASSACSEKHDMSCQQIQMILSVLGRLGAGRINLSGGEPLLRKDIDKILESAFLLKSKISLTTNGILVPQYLDLLKGLDFLCISINGTKKTHNYLAGSDTHEVVMEAIALSRAKQIQVLLSSVVTAKTTKEDIRFLLELADHHDVFCVFQPVFEGGYFEEGFVKFDKLNSVVPALEQLRDLFDYMERNPFKKRVVGGKDFIEFILKFISRKTKDVSRPMRCSAGNGFFYISPSGNMYPCSLRFLKLLKGKFYESPLEEIGKIEKPISCQGCCCYSNNILDKVGRLDLRAMAGILMNQYIK